MQIQAIDRRVLDEVYHTTTGKGSAGESAGPMCFDGAYSAGRGIGRERVLSQGTEGTQRSVAPLHDHFALHTV